MENDEDFLKELDEATCELQKNEQIIFIPNAKGGNATVEKSSKPVIEDNIEITESKKPSKPISQANNQESDPFKELSNLMGGLPEMGLNPDDPEFMNLMSKLQEGLSEFKQTADPKDPKTKPNSNSTNENSNPFQEAFNEMNPSNDLDKLFNMFSMQEGGSEDFGKLFDVLGKLSDNNFSDLNGDKIGKGTNKDQSNNEIDENAKKELYPLFENLLEMLLKTNMLAEPLTGIKTSIQDFIKSKKDLSADKLNKYKDIIESIDIILEELKKSQPDKTKIIDIFYQLHEISDLDNELFANLNSDFGDLLRGGKPGLKK